MTSLKFLGYQILDSQKQMITHNKQQDLAIQLDILSLLKTLAMSQLLGFKLLTKFHLM